VRIRPISVDSRIYKHEEKVQINNGKENQDGFQNVMRKEKNIERTGVLKGNWKRTSQKRQLDLDPQLIKNKSLKTSRCRTLQTGKKILERKTQAWLN
jgi:hypothetical protein